MNKVRESFEKFFHEGKIWAFPPEFIDWLAQFDNMDIVPMKQQGPEIEPCYLHPTLTPELCDKESYSAIVCVEGCRNGMATFDCWSGPACNSNQEAITEWNKLMRLARGGVR